MHDKRNTTPTGHGHTKTPDAVMRGDTTKKAAAPIPIEEGPTTEPGNPAGYPVHCDPGSRGY